jgi:anti-anti-sigma factor
MDGLELTTTDEGEAVRIVLRGEFDIAGAERLEAALARAEAGAPRVLVLDLSELEFMDSTGLRIVLAADARARDDGRELRIVRGAEAVRRLFHLTGLDGRLNVVDADPV